MVEKLDPERFKSFVKGSQKAAEQRWGVYQQLAGITIPQPVISEDEGADARDEPN